MLKMCSRNGTSQLLRPWLLTLQGLRSAGQWERADGRRWGDTQAETKAASLEPCGQHNETHTHTHPPDIQQTQLADPGIVKALRKTKAWSDTRRLRGQVDAACSPPEARVWTQKEKMADNALLLMLNQIQKKGELISWNPTHHVPLHLGLTVSELGLW